MTWDKKELWTPSSQEEWEAWRRKTIRRANLLNRISLASFATFVGISITTVILEITGVKTGLWQVGWMIFTSMVAAVSSTKRALDTVRNMKIIDNLKKQGYLRVVRSEDGPP